MQVKVVPVHIGNATERIPPIFGIPYRIFALLLPLSLLTVHIALLYITLPYDRFLMMIGFMVTYMLPPAGKETVIPVGIALGFSWWYMALSIAMIDIETGAFMALNFDLAYKIPVLGKILVVVTKKTAEFVKSCRWISGLFFFGIVLMVMVPVVGSGGIRGSIGGKILGMDTPVVFMAIAAGALAGCFGIALGSEFILRQICMHGSLPADIGAFVCSRP